MATIERAVARLKKERAVLVLTRDHHKVLASREKDRVFKKEYLDLAKESGDRIQVIDYVLSFLESEEEVVCPG